MELVVIKRPRVFVCGFPNFALDFAYAKLNPVKLCRSR